MSVCNAALENLIETTDDIDAVVRAVQTAEEIQRTEHLAIKARYNKGRYSIPSRRVSTYIDKSKDLLGKKVVLEDVDGYGFREVIVKKAEAVGSNQVRVNNEFTVDIQKNTTVDGMYGVEILGSEEVHKGNTETVATISGTILADIDTIVEGIKENDNEGVSTSHTQYLEEIIKAYREAVQESGKDVEITVEVLKDLQENVGNTRGFADPETGKIGLIRGNNRLNGGLEILAHELQHVLIRKVLKENKHLANKVLELRDAMRKEFDYTVFLNGVENPTTEDVEAAKKRYAYVFENPNSKTAADEFLAYATTNQQLVEALALRQVPDGTIVAMSELEIDDKKHGKMMKKFRKMWNIIAKAVNKAYAAYVTKGYTSHEYALSLLETALEIQHGAKEDRRKSYYKQTLDAIARVDKKVAEATGEIKKESRKYGDLVKDKGSTIDKIVDSAWKIKGLARFRSNMLKNNVFNSITRDMENPDIAKFYQMFRHAKAFVENAVAPMKTSTIKVLTENYGFGNDDMPVEMRRAAKRVLIDLDAAVLGKSEDILAYLEDKSKTRNEIDGFLDKHESNPKYNQLVKAMDDLAGLLVTNSTKSRDVYVNAAQIAVGLGVDIKVDDIDKVVTLMAFLKAGEENKELTIDALKQNPQGIDYVLAMKKKDEEELLEKAYFGNKMESVKGAKQEKYMGDKRYYIVKKKEMQELKKAKMVDLGKHDELSTIFGEDMYVMVGESLDVTYTEGLLSAVQLRNEGESIRRLLIDLNEMTEEEADARIDEIAMQFDGTDAQSANALIPERSGVGDIYDYRLRVPHQSKVEDLEVEDDLVYTISETVANLTHKQEAMLNNYASLLHMDRFHKKYKDDKDFNFVLISKDSTGKEKEYWDILPAYMKQQVTRTMGGKLYVEEAMLVNYFGYQDVSLINAPWINKSKKRQLVAKKVENVIFEISKSWKHSVVAKTFATVQGNTSSNMLVALQHMEDKNPLEYLKRFQKMWGHMNDYKKLKEQKSRLEIRLSAGEDIRQEDIDRLTVRMENSPVHIIMEDGQYTHIMEDIDKDWFKDKGIIEERLDAAIAKAENKKGTNHLKDIIDFLYIRQDSPMYDSVMKFTLYSDAINKLIIEEDLRVTNPEMTQRDRLNYVDRLHVNYGYLDNRWVKYANDTLVFSFTKYFFRVLPAMLKMLGKKSLTVFLTESTQKVSGFDFETPWDQFFSPVDSLLRKMSVWSNPLNVFQLLFTPAAVR